MVSSNGFPIFIASYLNWTINQRTTSPGEKYPLAATLLSQNVNYPGSNNVQKSPAKYNLFTAVHTSFQSIIATQPLALRNTKIRPHGPGTKT